jgi:UDP:flavonoid glycosyltransferase YjiC (YdhE family)
MKIVLVTFGSRGDVQPMVALSLALKSAGHGVLLAGPPEKAAWAQKLGCPFHPLGGNVTAFLDGMEDAHSIRSALRFLSYIHKEVRAQFDILQRIIAGADLVVGSSLALALSTVAESMGIPYRYIAFTPQLLPSGFHPFPACKHHGLPTWWNRVTWRFGGLFDQFNLTWLINKRRKQLGLKPVQDAWLHILGRHVIVASDEVIAKVPQDVGPAFTQTGYMHLDQSDQHLPELESFLSAGPAPVYAGFGSMPKRDQASNLPLIVGAARAVGRGVVIAKFWEEPSQFSNADDVFFIKGYPHLKLFPHMAAVIHHGGAGTTASSAISGVPQIIVPHALDQFYWGYQVYHAHLGPKAIWRSKLTSRKLAAAIHTCLSDDLIRHQAKTASQMIDPLRSLEMTVREVARALD